MNTLTIKRLTEDRHKRGPGLSCDEWVVFVTNAWTPIPVYQKDEVTSTNLRNVPEIIALIITAEAISRIDSGIINEGIIVYRSDSFLIILKSINVKNADKFIES